MTSLNQIAREMKNVTYSEMVNNLVDVIRNNDQSMIKVKAGRVTQKTIFEKLEDGYKVITSDKYTGEYTQMMNIDEIKTALFLMTYAQAL